MLADHLRTLLASRTVEHVASTMGIARSAIYAWLSGEKLPTPRNLGKFLAAVDLDRDNPETWDLYVRAQRERAA